MTLFELFGAPAVLWPPHGEGPSPAQGRGSGARPPHLKSVPPISRLAHRLLHTSNTVFKKCGSPCWFLAPPSGFWPPPAAKSWRRACHGDSSPEELYPPRYAPALVCTKLVCISQVYFLCLMTASKRKAAVKIGMQYEKLTTDSKFYKLPT